MKSIKNKKTRFLITLAVGFIAAQILLPAHFALAVPSYAIGDTGPAGGLIFYIDGETYYESAPSNWYGGADPLVEWGCDSPAVIDGADGTVIGTGEQNTADILADCAQAGIAARLADDYTTNGYDDWFLPSKDELNAMYQNLYLSSVGGFTNGGGYWTSSDYLGGAWRQYFGNGSQGGFGRSLTFGVHPARSFTQASLPSAGSNTTIGASIASTISISTSGTVSMTVTPASGGRLSSAKDTVTVSTNNSTGYSLSFTTSSGSELLGNGNYIDTTAATQASPGPLGVNQWGYRVDGIGGFGAGPTSAESNATGSTFTWAGLPEPGPTQALKSTGGASANDTTTVWYGVRVDTSKPSDNYSQTVIYTAVTN